MAYTRPNGADRFKDLSQNREGLPSFELDNEFNGLAAYVSGIAVIASPNDQYNEEVNTPTYVDPTTFTLPGDLTATYHTGRKLQFDLSGTFVYSTVVDSTEAGGTTTVTIEDAVLNSNLSTVYYGVLAADHTSAMPTNLIPDDAVNYLHRDGSVDLYNEAAIFGENLAGTSNYSLCKVGSDNKTHFGDTSTGAIIYSSVTPKWNDGSEVADLLITGEIRMWSTGSAPAGWLLCQGQAVSRTTYDDLFNTIGTTYGAGNGSTTFNLPDFRGRSPVGVGTGDAGYATSWSLAEKGGAEKHKLVDSEMPSHHHTKRILANQWGAATSDITGGAGAEVGTMTTSTAGSDAAHANMHPVLGINFIIKT